MTSFTSPERSILGLFLGERSHAVLTVERKLTTVGAPVSVGVVVQVFRCWGGEAEDK